MITLLVFVLALEYRCLAQFRSHGLQNPEDHGSEHREENIDDKYFHPYVYASKEQLIYYLQMGVTNGQITQDEMDRELRKLEHPLTARVDQRSKLRKIRYWLYSKSLSNPNRIMLGHRAASRQNGWNYGQDVKIIIHGWSHNLWLSADDKISVQGMFNLATAYLKYPYNIIVVDWTVLSSETLINYPVAAEGAVIAAEDVAEFVEDLQAKGLIHSMKKVHIIGFSLGAHVAGRTGYLLSRSLGKVGRVTGLDPAGPNFAYLTFGKDLRYAHISSSNADFVDIIHCNQGHALTGNAGSDRKTGHVDILANGGSNQPGCNIVNNYKGCSHGKCPVYFRDSIWKKDAMRACKTLSNSNCPWYKLRCWFGRSALNGQELRFQNRMGKENFSYISSKVVKRVSARALLLSGRTTRGTDCVSFGEWCPKNARGTYYLTT